MGCILQYCHSGFRIRLCRPFPKRYIRHQNRHFPNRRNRKLMNVSTMYMTYKILAVVRIFGTSLFTFGPGLSARSRCMVYPLPLSPFGESARRNTSTPMPPSQWLKLRQYIIPGESASTSPRIEEPVVVNPDTISNRASTKFGISLEKQMADTRKN